MDLRYHYARLGAGGWHDEEIAHAGTRPYSGEDDYSGLGALDPNNPDVLYISTDADPVSGAPLISAADNKRRYELFRGERSVRRAVLRRRICGRCRPRRSGPNEPSARTSRSRT